MSGRHESWQVRRWAPTALNAVVAVVPAGTLLSAAGAAGSGYLLQRADIAAAGAGAAAVGLVVERLQTRCLRRRVRRERWQWRAEREEMREGLDELRRDLAGAHRTLNVLRSRVQTLPEWTGQMSRPAMTEIAARRRLACETGAFGDAATLPLRRFGFPLPAGTAVNPLPASPLPANPLPASPLPARSAAGRPTPGGTERRRPMVTLARQPVACGAAGWRPSEAGYLPCLPIGPAEPVRTGSGVPTLPPGPRDPVSGPLAIVVDRAAIPRETTRRSSQQPRAAATRRAPDLL